MLKTAIGVVFLALFANSSIAGEKRIVFGAQLGPNGETYEVGFCARGKDMGGDGPGHAFVVLQQFGKDKRRTEFLTAGFGPPESKPVHAYGLISPEYYSHPSQECLIAETNRAKYEQLRVVIQNQTEYTFAGVTIKLKRPYVVVFDDCVTFLQSVAKEFGLVVPSRIEGLTPLTYVKSLRAAN